jgi:hypothetical protein
VFESRISCATDFAFSRAGAKRTCTLQVASGATGPAVQSSSATRKSPAEPYAPPLVRTRDTSSGAVPVFLTTTACEPLIVAPAWVGKIDG